MSHSLAVHMFNNVTQFWECLAISITEDGEKYPRKGIKSGNDIRGEKISAFSAGHGNPNQDIWTVKEWISPSQ